MIVRSKFDSASAYLARRCRAGSPRRPRVDLSDELPESVEHIAEVAASARPDAAIAVVVDAFNGDYTVTVDGTPTSHC
ncbi:hypothetical protein [Mycobacterium sp. 1164985.4]|uniref:hypothetical protein n=1 Tax=Mycobacterium sp. 1164985.4 TaxID=1834069 RepID=UPI0007FC6CA3|nr:hypothetical protein [Mycobacterium sp. 1164985.4]OBK72672.1 hypothetical protein A5650_22295 [Mycobacterium sp. 1164985.4]